MYTGGFWGILLKIKDKKEELAQQTPASNLNGIFFDSFCQFKK